MYIVYNANTGGIIETTEDYDIAIETMTNANQILGLHCNTRRWYKNTETELYIHNNKTTIAPISIRIKDGIKSIK